MCARALSSSLSLSLFLSLFLPLSLPPSPSLPLSLSHARSLRCGIIAMVGWRAPPPPPPPMCTCRWQIWEGGHRVPGVVSWPAVVRGPARESWATVITSDFLPTVMEVLNVERPPAQRSWAMDGAWAWAWGWWIS
jgi:hypothetical protein